MVTLERSAASSAHRTPRARRVPFVAAAILLAGFSHAGAQSHPAHLSDDLKKHIDFREATGTTVIPSGSAPQGRAIAPRHRPPGPRRPGGRPGPGRPAGPLS